MCSTNKCCFFFNLNFASLLLAGGSFLFSLILVVICSVYLAKEEETTKHVANLMKHHLQLFKIEITDFSAISILISGICLGILLMIVSALLFVGLKKRKPGFILSYFCFGIFLTIVFTVGGLLLLLGSHWVLFFIIFISTYVYVHYLVVIYKVYEEMQKSVGSSSHSDADDDLLSVTSFSESRLDTDANRLGLA